LWFKKKCKNPPSSNGGSRKIVSFVKSLVILVVKILITRFSKKPPRVLKTPWQTRPEFVVTNYASMLLWFKKKNPPSSNGAERKIVSFVKSLVILVVKILTTSFK
jgi:hypothetical protein